ncbi:hypothetical protein GCM10027567_14060 [Spongiibacter taiwanensis]
MRRVIAGPLFAIWWAFITGCVSTVNEVQPDYRTFGGRGPRSPNGFSAQNTICLAYTDERASEVSAYTSVSRESAKQWLENALQQTFGLPVILDTLPASPTSTEVILRRAYFRGMGTPTIAANVVLSLRLGESEYTYRGQYTKTNWFSADSEYEASLDKALQQALTKIAANQQARSVYLAARCQL